MPWGFLSRPGMQLLEQANAVLSHFHWQDNVKAVSILPLFVSREFRSPPKKQKNADPYISMSGSSQQAHRPMQRCFSFFTLVQSKCGFPAWCGWLNGLSYTVLWFALESASTVCIEISYSLLRIYTGKARGKEISARLRLHLSMQTLPQYSVPLRSRKATLVSLLRWQDESGDGEEAAGRHWDSSAGGFNEKLRVRTET